MPQGQTRTQYWGWYTISVSTLRATAGSHKCTDVLSVGRHHKLLIVDFYLPPLNWETLVFIWGKVVVRFLFLMPRVGRIEAFVQSYSMFQVMILWFADIFFTLCTHCGMLAPRKNLNNCEYYEKLHEYEYEVILVLIDLRHSCVLTGGAWMSMNRTPKIWCCIFKCLLQASTPMITMKLDNNYTMGKLLFNCSIISLSVRRKCIIIIKPNTFVSWPLKCNA